MSKIEELIQKLCPNGIEYKKIGDLAEVGTGSSNANESEDNGIYPFFIRSKTIKYKNEYEYDEEALIIPGEGGVGDIFHYVKGKYALHQRVYRIHFLTDSINVKFVYYYMQNAFKPFIMKKAVNATVTSIRKGMITDFSIPFSPVEIQEEIVRILDKFAAMSEKLNKELELRKKQYEYYREKMLSFEGLNVEWKPIEDIAYYPKKHIPINEINLYVGVENLLKDKKGVCKAEITTSSNNAIEFLEGDILVGNIRPYLKKIWHSDCRGGTNGDVVLLRIKEAKKKLYNNRFLYFLISSDKFFDYANQNSKGGKMPRGDKSKILQYKVPVPSLKDQERIVSILDKFDTLVNDQEKGLPAEIRKVQQQYEYYRDKLLTF